MQNLVFVSVVTNNLFNQAYQISGEAGLNKSLSAVDILQNIQLMAAEAPPDAAINFTFGFVNPQVVSFHHV